MGIRRILSLFILALPAAALLLSAAGCEGKRDAAGVAEDYVTLYAAGDFAEAFELLAEDSFEKQNRTLDEYVREAESSYGGPYEVTELIFKPQGKESELVPFILQGGLQPVDGGEAMILSGEISMVEVDGEWQVSVIEWVAVPESQVPFDMLN